MAIDIAKLKIPAVSPDGLKALELISRPDPDIKQLERIILLDPILASTLIKYANSPLYRRTNKITNVPGAIRVLGLRNIRSAVVMATMRALARPEAEANRAIWGHSIDISMLCKLIARETAPDIADDMEFIGLIHDLGLLVLANSFPARYNDLLRQARLEGTAIDELELAEFGQQHDMIVRHVLEKFRIPDEYITMLSGFHTHPPLGPELGGTNLQLAILELAHHLWLRALPRTAHIPETIVEAVESLQKRLGIADDFMEHVFEELSERK